MKAAKKIQFLILVIFAGIITANILRAIIY
jgi:hypothetical protein